MRRVKVLTVFMVVTIMVIPFASFSKAQSNGYVGIREGSEYEWRINLNLAGVNNIMQNVENLMTEIQTRISEMELFGLATKTLPEVMENLSHRVLDKILPFGWEGLNITELLEETAETFVEDFNSTVLNGFIPSNWESLNYSTFMDYVIEGLNSTLPDGWDDHPIPHLISIAINTFNNSILFGIIPENWDQLTLDNFLESVITNAFPIATESFIPYILMDQMLSQLYAVLPPGSESQIIRDLFPYMMPPDVFNMNLTTILDGLWWAINSTAPPGWDAIMLSEFIENQGDQLNVNLTQIDPMLDGANMSAILKWGIGMEMSMMNASMPLGMFPPNWMDMPIRDLAISFIEQGKTMFTTVVLPQWNSMYAAIQTAGAVVPTTYGMKVIINSIGAERTSTLGGQRGTEFDFTFLISMDMQNWTDFVDLMSDLMTPTGELFMATPSLSTLPPPMEINVTTSLLYTLLNITMEGYIVDPSSYSDPKFALMDQAVFTKGLIVASNYDWTTINTDITIEANGNVDAFEISASWNSMGLLSQATLSSDGVTAITISLYTGEQEIPGYEMTILMIVMPLTVVGIIYYIRKKNR